MCPAGSLSKDPYFQRAGNTIQVRKSRVTQDSTGWDSLFQRAYPNFSAKAL